MLLAIESSAASIASAWISAAALVAVVVFGVLNLRRSARGAVGSAKWQLQHVKGAQYELLQVGSAPAYGVTVTVDGETPFDGQAEFAVFEVNQRAVYAILSTDQTQPRLAISWAPSETRRWRPKPKPKTWTTDVVRG